MNNKRIGVTISLLILIAGAAYFWFKYNNNEASKLEAKRQAEISKPKIVAPINNMTSQQAGKHALENLEISKIPSANVGSGADYFALNVLVSKGDGFKDLLSQFYSEPVSLIVMTAQIVAPKNAYPATPILVLKSSGGGTAPFEILHQANGQVLPFISSASSGGNDVALDIHYLNGNISAAEILKIIEDAKSLKKEASDTTAILKKHRAKFYDNLMQLHIGPERSALFGRKIALKNNTASIELSLLSKPAQFASQNADGSTLVKTGEIERFLKGVGTKNEKLQVDFWLNEGEGFVDTCRDLSAVLGDVAGLSLTDTALVLWSLIHRHAWFAKDIDYQTDCLNQAQSAALQKLKLELPNEKNTRQNTPGNASMNATLATLVKVLRKGDPEATKVNLSALIADKTTLLDRAGIWLFGDQIKQNDSGRILESADQKAAIDQLFALPVTHFGCFSRGDGLKGRHRTTLAQFGASPELWELEFAFNRAGKIVGVTLDEADTETICRAIGDRRSGENACYFARRASQFPIISESKCGK